MKGVNWVHIDKIRSYGLEKSQFGHTIQTSGQMVLKGVIWFEMSDLGTHYITSGQIVLKGVKCVHNHKIRSNGLERSQLGTQ